jgi:N-acyl-L-homoserine lactone synthetase
MLQVINGSNADLHSGLLRSFSMLRYDTFIRRLGWKLSSPLPGMELDEFDDERAVYLVAANQHAEVIAGARLLDTSHRSLLAELFPNLVCGYPPRDPRVFEVTRFVVDHRPERLSGTRNICAKLLWGLQEYGTWAKLTHLVSVSYVGMEPILRRAGYRFDRMGGTLRIDGNEIVALKHEVSSSVRKRSELRARGAEPLELRLL